MGCSSKKSFDRRTDRIRFHLKQRAGDRKRLSVFRSNQHIYAQIIDDRAGTTLAAASTLDKEIEKSLKKGWNLEAAQAVGKLLAKRALKEGIKEVFFDRGGYLYHGRVKALADSAREEGLVF